MWEYLLSLDYRLFTWINSSLSFAAGDAFFPWVTDLQKMLYFKILVVPLVAFFFIRKFGREGITLFLFLLLAVGASDFSGGKLKHIPERERPFSNPQIHDIQRSGAGGYSFYSNHSSNMFTFATYTAQFVPQLSIPLYLVAFTIAYSRVYNGVHYPSDVIAGALMGIFWGLLFASLARRLVLYLKNRKKT